VRIHYILQIAIIWAHLLFPDPLLPLLMPYLIDPQFQRTLQCLRLSINLILDLHALYILAPHSYPPLFLSIRSLLLLLLNNHYFNLLWLYSIGNAQNAEFFILV